jgi:hypothetical protein
MNRMIILENLLALAAVVVLGPGTSILVQQAAKQAVGQALGLTKPRKQTLH